MDRLNVRNEVRARLGETVEDFWKNVDLNNGIDEAVRRFNREEKWPWLYSERLDVSLLANADTVALEPNVSFNRHFAVTYTQSGDTTIYIPKRIDPAEGFRLRASYFNNKQKPMWFYIASAVTDDPGGYIYTVRFVPTPNVNLLVDYSFIRAATPLADDAAEPDIPEDYIEAIIAWTTGNAWLKELNGGNKAQEQFNIYGKVVDDAKRDVMGLAPDEELSWGGEEPRFDPFVLDPRVRMPSQLG